MRFLIILFLLLSSTTNVLFAKGTKNDTLSIQVQGNCGQCKERIEEAAFKVKGVKLANWDKKTKELIIIFNAKKANKEKIEKAIAAAGHDTEKCVATDAQYNELPGCCAYRTGKCDHDD